MKTNNKEHELVDCTQLRAEVFLLHGLSAKSFVLLVCYLVALLSNDWIICELCDP